MGLAETLGLLSHARRRVADGNKCLVAQRMIIEDLERDGYDTLTILFLEYLEEAQAEYVAYRNRLERKLYELSFWTELVGPDNGSRDESIR
jgi:hypothetical protein